MTEWGYVPVLASSTTPYEVSFKFEQTCFWKLALTETKLLLNSNSERMPSWTAARSPCPRRNWRQCTSKAVFLDNKCEMREAGKWVWTKSNIENWAGSRFSTNVMSNCRLAKTAHQARCLDSECYKVLHCLDTSVTLCRYHTLQQLGRV